MLAITIKYILNLKNEMFQSLVSRTSRWVGPFPEWNPTEKKNVKFSDEGERHRQVQASGGGARTPGLQRGQPQEVCRRLLGLNHIKLFSSDSPL
jgi:hypothetical protein